MSDFKAKCTKFDFGWGSAPDPTGGDPQGLVDMFQILKKYPGSRDPDHAPLGRNFSFLVGIPNTGQFSHTRVSKCT